MFRTAAQQILRSSRVRWCAGFAWLMAGGASFLVAGCSSEAALPKQHLVEWQAERLLFVADERSGSIRAFSLATTAPTPLAFAPSPRRHSVRALALDAEHGRLWVLGGEQVEVFDARRLRSLGQQPAEGARALRLDGGAVVLLADDGHALGRVEASALRVAAEGVPTVTAAAPY
ncbi:hypothetical protein GH865_03295 [Rhodocyclus tenuis]|uniref:hypothetical protein n=1 Tax=Rhodocyclus gracilis TaxID=2929842 RepID=UPI001354FA54|nr:hypothetical protein [Rhodocyclus gracilis]MRD72277.1 hypothetical protein [Rhodocyclus gracilis]